MRDRLKPNESQGNNSGNALIMTSINKEVGLDFHGDSLRLSQNGKEYWSQKLPPHSAQGGIAIMQPDGNFLVKDKAGKVVWATNTAGHPGAYLVLQNDHNLVLYPPSGGKALWAASTKGFKHGGFDFTEIALMAVGIPPGTFSVVKAISPSTGQWMQNAVSTAGKAAGSAVHAISEATGKLSAEVGKVPFIGPLFSALVDVTLAGPFHFSDDIARGVRLDKAVMRELERQLKDFKQIGPYAQMIFSMVPGFGPFVAGAIGAGLALANGQPLDQVLLAGVKGMLPGGPLAQMAIDIGIKAVSMATSPGGFKNFNNIGSIVGLAADALPVPDIAKGVIKGAVNIAAQLASGQRVDQALLDGAITMLPLDKLPKEAANAIVQAKEAIKRIAKGQRVDTVLLDTGLHALPIDSLPIPKEAKDALSHVATAATKIVQGGHVDKVLLDEAFKAIPPSIMSKLPDVAQKAISHVGQVAVGLAEHKKISELVANTAMSFIKDQKLVPAAVTDALKIGATLGHAQGLQNVINVTVKASDFGNKLAKAAQGAIQTNGITKAASAAIPATVQQGFTQALGLMQHSNIPMLATASLRAALPDAHKVGFDLAVSLHIGQTTAKPPPSHATPTQAAGYFMTKGMMGSNEQQRTAMATVMMTHPEIKQGMVVAVKDVAAARSGGFWAWLRQLLGLDTPTAANAVATVHTN